MSVVRLAVTGEPSWITLSPARPVSAFPAGSVTVAAIVYEPGTMPVVSKVPRSTVGKFPPSSGTTTGVEAKTTCPPGSVTVKDARAGKGLAVTFSTRAETPTTPPGSVKATLGVTEAISTKAFRAVNEPEALPAISEPPSAAAVTVKPVGRISPVPVSVRTAPSGPPKRDWPGWRVTDEWLKLAVTPEGRPVTLRS